MLDAFAYFFDSVAPDDDFLFFSVLAGDGDVAVFSTEFFYVGSDDKEVGAFVVGAEVGDEAGLMDECFVVVVEFLEDVTVVDVF